MPYGSNGAASRRKPPIKIGLIGVTGYGLAYFEGINKLVDAGEVEWGAVTIINRDQAQDQVRFLEARGVPIYPDYQQMLEAEGDRLDWMCIPTAIGWHTRMTVDSLRRGIPVLVEKPLAPTLQEVAEIQAAERESGLLVAVGFQHSYLRGTWEIKRRLLAGEIGEIRRIDSIGLWPRHRAYYQRNNWGGRLHDGQSWVLDSPLQNALGHVANLILFFAGETLSGRAEPIEIEAEIYRAKAIECYDTLRTAVRLDTGVQTSIVLSHSSLNKIDPEIRIVGTKGDLLWRFCGAHTFTAGAKVDTLRTRGHVPMREHMFENVLRRIRGEEDSIRICTTEQAKGSVKWVNAVHDVATIHDIPTTYRRELVDENGDTFDVIENLDYHAIRSYCERRSFTDVNAPWAVPAGRREISNYVAFEGRCLPATTLATAAMAGIVHRSDKSARVVK